MNEKIIIVFVMSLAFIGYDYFYQQPARSMELDNILMANETLRTDLETALTAKGKIERLEAGIAKAKIISADLARQLPKRSEAGAFLEQITGSAAGGVVFDSVIPSPPSKRIAKVKLKPVDAPENVAYEEIEMALELRASFRELGLYLQCLEQIQRLVEVDSLDMTLRADNEPLSVKMKIKTFMYDGK
ncbi:MAG: hypothetical protein EOM80_18525 [Erysipelotrichia bacterium]|nr:type 4a pilus biogenesis protein PilO [Candidatus Riflebacteria bacterium]NCB40758.1 hypothetical protein [Erysipelotrichia bacterium]